MWEATKNREEKQRYADMLDSSVAHMSNIAYGHKIPSKRFAELLAFKIGDGSTKETLFPKIFS